MRRALVSTSKAVSYTHLEPTSHIINKFSGRYIGVGYEIFVTRDRDHLSPFFLILTFEHSFSNVLLAFSILKYSFEIWWE